MRYVAIPFDFVIMGGAVTAQGSWLIDLLTPLIDVNYEYQSWQPLIYFRASFGESLSAASLAKGLYLSLSNQPDSDVSVYLS